MSGREKYYTLTSPCAKCPFRDDIEPYLYADRVEGIIDSLRGGSGFTCHKTTVEGEEDESGFTENVDGPNARHCAGALILMEKEGEANQMMRIAERIGMYDASKLNMDAPVYDDFDSMIDCHADVMGWSNDDELDEEEE